MAEWTTVVLEAIKFAALRLAAYPGGTAPGGHTAADFVYDAVDALDYLAKEDNSFASLLETEIKMSGIKALGAVLEGQIKREIRNYFARRRRHRKLLRIREADAPQPVGFADPETTAEQAQRRRRIRDALVESSTARPLAAKVLHLMFTLRTARPSELGPLVGVSEEVIYEELRWLRRQMEKIEKRLDKEEVG